jgi:hypothetical protein
MGGVEVHRNNQSCVFRIIVRPNCQTLRSVAGRNWGTDKQQLGNTRGARREREARKRHGGRRRVALELMPEMMHVCERESEYDVNTAEAAEEGDRMR